MTENVGQLTVMIRMVGGRRNASYQEESSQRWECVRSVWEADKERGRPHCRTDGAFCLSVSVTLWGPTVVAGSHRCCVTKSLRPLNIVIKFQGEALGLRTGRD